MMGDPSIVECWQGMPVILRVQMTKLQLEVPMTNTQEPACVSNGLLACLCNVCTARQEVEEEKVVNKLSVLFLLKGPCPL